MKKELRYGKYTDNEFVQLIFNRMSYSEQEKIKKGLDFLELKLEDVIFPKEINTLKGKNKINQIPSVTNNFFLKRLNEKRAQITSNEQGIIYNEFKDILPNIFNECTKFGEEEGDNKEIVSGYESIFKIVPAIRARYGKEIKSDTEDILTNFKNEHHRLKEEKHNLKWKGDQKTLFKISKSLFENETTNDKNAFTNAINNGETCVINSKRKDFFVLLFYKLIEEPSPMVGTEKTSGKGAIGAASRFFCHKGKTHNRNISMPDQMKRINKKLLENDKILQKIKEEVAIFLKEI